MIATKVFQFANLKHEDWNTQNNSFTCCFMRVWNLVSHIEGGTQPRGVSEECEEEDMWS